MSQVSGRTRQGTNAIKGEAADFARQPNEDWQLHND